jgi:hypothetical protein
MNFITSNWFIISDPPYCFGYAILKDKLGQKHISPAIGVGTDHYDKSTCAGLATSPPPSSILVFLKDIGSIFYIK